MQVKMCYSGCFIKDLIKIRIFLRICLLKTLNDDIYLSVTSMNYNYSDLSTLKILKCPYKTYLQMYIKVCIYNVYKRKVKSVLFLK